jgi:hypothetical protein
VNTFHATGEHTPRITNSTQKVGKKLGGQPVLKKHAEHLKVQHCMPSQSMNSRKVSPAVLAWGEL